MILLICHQQSRSCGYLLTVWPRLSCVSYGPFEGRLSFLFPVSLYFFISSVGPIAFCQFSFVVSKVRDFSFSHSVMYQSLLYSFHASYRLVCCRCSDTAFLRQFLQSPGSDAIEENRMPRSVTKCQNIPVFLTFSVLQALFIIL